MKRGKEGHINIAISSFSQKLPVEMDKYWNSSLNKIRFQQSFIKWVLQNYDGTKEIVLGGGSSENENECLVISNKQVSKIGSLKSSHEEADDRIMLHINYEVMKGTSSIIVASSDTDILVCLLYHLVKWKTNGLSCLWNVRGPSIQRKINPLHVLLADIGENIAIQLPAMHSLTGCDTVSKVGTKYSALKKLPSDLISNFGLQECTEEMIEMAENFLVD